MSFEGRKSDEKEWNEEWEDFSSCQDLLTILRQQNKKI